MKDRPVILFASGLLLLGVVVFLAFFFSSHATRFDAFNRVFVGMSEAQVKDVLKTAHRVRHDRPDTTAYCYGGFQRFKWCTMEIYFDAEKRVTGKFHDH